MGYSEITYEKKGPIAYITLNRPDKMNALSLEPGGLLEQWEEACDDAKTDRNIMSSAPPELQEFFTIMKEQGLKAALEWRDAKFSEITDDKQDLRSRKYNPWSE